MSNTTGTSTIYANSKPKIFGQTSSGKTDLENLTLILPDLRPHTSTMMDTLISTINRQPTSKRNVSSTSVRNVSPTNTKTANTSSTRNVLLTKVKTVPRSKTKKVLSASKTMYLITSTEKINIASKDSGTTQSASLKTDSSSSTTNNLSIKTKMTPHISTSNVLPTTSKTISLTSTKTARVQYTTKKTTTGTRMVLEPSKGKVTTTSVTNVSPTGTNTVPAILSGAVIPNSTCTKKLQDTSTNIISPASTVNVLHTSAKITIMGKHPLSSQKTVPAPNIRKSTSNRTRTVPLATTRNVSQILTKKARNSDTGKVEEASSYISTGMSRVPQTRNATRTATPTSRSKVPPNSTWKVPPLSLVSATPVQTSGSVHSGINLHEAGNGRSDSKLLSHQGISVKEEALYPPY